MKRKVSIEVSRGTRCFSAFHGTDLNGAFPRGFLEWLRVQGWMKGEICHLCSGRVKGDGFRVDIRPEMEPDLVADATDTKLPEHKFDTTVIDPPYSKDLAQKLYGTGENFASINAFVKEGVRITRPGGLIVSLSYELPKIPKNAQLIAVWGIYTVPHTSFMRCLAVFKKSLPSLERINPLWGNAHPEDLE